MPVCNQALYCVVKAFFYSVVSVTCLLVDMPKFQEKCGMSSVPLRPSASFSSNAVCFKIRNQFLGQIFVICHVLCIVGVKPKCQLVILSFMAKLPYNQLVTCQKFHRNCCCKGIYRKEGHSENYPDMTFILSFLSPSFVLSFFF